MLAQYRAAIEQHWKDVKLAYLTCALDREILLHRRFAVSKELQPLMLILVSDEEDNNDTTEANMNAITNKA